MFDGIKVRVIVFVVFVEAIMILRSIAYLYVNYPCTLSDFCPKPKMSVTKDDLQHYTLIEINKQFIFVTELVGSSFISYVALKSHEVDTCCDSREDANSLVRRNMSISLSRVKEIRKTTVLKRI